MSIFSISATNLSRPTFFAAERALSKVLSTNFWALAGSNSLCTVLKTALATFLHSSFTSRNHSSSSFCSALPEETARMLIAAETANMPLSNFASNEQRSLGKTSPFADAISPRLQPGLTLDSQDILRKASRIKKTRSLFLSISHNSLAIMFCFIRSAWLSFAAVKAINVSTSTHLSASASVCRTREGGSRQAYFSGAVRKPLYVFVTPALF